MAAEAGGRVETDYLLFALAGGEIMNELIGAQPGSPMYFGPQRAGLECLIYTAKGGRENKVYLK